MLERAFNAAWYGRLPWTWLLWPLSLLVGVITRCKRLQYLQARTKPYDVPVIVVGNITIGGTGKTPVVQSLVRFLQAQGYRPAVISRGYGGTVTRFPHLITSQDASSQVGDEPYMLFQSLAVPVVIDPVRPRAVAALLQCDVDVIISDDGLQHYALHRDYEICVIDGTRGLGNQQLMPVGPLREDKNRLNEVDYVLKSDVIAADDTFQITPLAWVNLKTQQHVELNDFSVKDNALAIAGIGNPEKFKHTLKSLGIQCEYQWFSDHYQYTPQDTARFNQQILMTEKDAAKINAFASDDMWYLKISADLPSAFLNNIILKLKQWKQDNG